MATAKWWNKNTRDEDGDYCRHGDWHVLLPEDQPKRNFTRVPPPAECLEENGPPCYWDEDAGTWVIDWKAAEPQIQEEHYNHVDNMMGRLFPRNERERLAGAMADPRTPAEAVKMIQDMMDWSDACWDHYYEVKTDIMAGKKRAYNPPRPPHTFREIMAVAREIR